MNESNRSAISRRRALSTMAYLSVGSVYMAAPRVSTAQDTPRVVDEILFWLGDIINDTEIGFGRVALSESPDISEIESTVRDDTLEVLLSVSNDQVLQLVSPENLRLAQEMRSRDIAVQKPDFELAKDPKAIVAEPEESCGVVVRGILLETLGIDKALHAKFSDVMDKRNLSDLVEQIAQEAREKRWARVTVLLKNLLRGLTSPATMALLEETLGKKAVTRILATMASRLVPVLGWTILAGALTVSLYNNWDRLEECSI